MRGLTRKEPLKTITVPAAPEGYEGSLSGYGPILFDPSCGEPIGWGFVIRRQLGEEAFNALARYGDLQCLDPRGGPGNWALVVERLTEEKAIEMYGPRTELELGPRGGFKTVTYGTRKFRSTQMRPDDYQECYRTGAYKEV
jgi:hypothetical protein